jgi:hypothetical protein
MRRIELSYLAVVVLAIHVAGCGGSTAGPPSTGNRPPVVQNQQATTDEDVAIDLHVLDGASDTDGDKLTVTSAAAPGHHVEIVDGAIVRLTPAPDFFGTIDVTFDVTDGMSHEVSAKASVTVRPVNDPPVATGGSQTVHGRHAVMLTGSDVDGDHLSFEVLQGPGHGTITGDAPALQYTPAAGFSGDDAISYRVSDGKLMSQPATWQLHATPGSAPSATAATVHVDEDHQIAIALSATDPDGDAVDYTIVTRPAHGTLSGTAPHLVYTPDRDFHGDDSLEFSVSDSYFSSDPATVTIHVASVDDAPVATAQAVPAVEDTSVDITLSGTDVDGDALSFRAAVPN